MRGDVSYREWLFSTPKVPVSVVEPWVDMLVERHDGDISAVARRCRLDDEVIRRVHLRKKKCVSATTAEAIAVEANRMVELALAMPELGREGWSEVGRYCGDGCELDTWGCGSWWHEPGLYGLCGECTAIALGLLDGPTRDVRFTREREEARAAKEAAA
jgi:hypothetical protein